MCGIIGIVNQPGAASHILEGLRRLAYRGYDSAGIATLSDGAIDRRRASGKIEALASRLAEAPLSGQIGIGHTRWATHGAPTVENAHPHATELLAIVHNGIIENYQELRAQFDGDNTARFESETDTEIVAQLISQQMRLGQGPEAAVAAVLPQLQGAYAFVVLFRDDPDLLICARQGTPMAIGTSGGGTSGGGNGTAATVIASDAVALAGLAREAIYLADGDWAVVRGGDVIIRDREGQKAERPARPINLSGAAIGKGDYRHFMEKEIHEQPDVISDTLNAYLHPSTGEVTLPDLPVDLSAVQRLVFAACGTAFYAGLAARYWFDHVARLPVDIDIASEYRYRDPAPVEGGLFLTVSQSGETLDTLEAMRFAQRNGLASLSIVNVPESTMAREAGQAIMTLAGAEIGVASTKAFTTQLSVLALLAIEAAIRRGHLDRAGARQHTSALREVPAKIAEVLKLGSHIRTLARDLIEARSVLYLGRGANYPLALEGALKLKEISYIHAEGFAAGEMKHGPIALIDETVPVVAIVPDDRWLEKSASNMREAAARGARILVIGGPEAVERLQDIATWTIELPAMDPFIAPIVYAVPVQLLAYHAAVWKGTDVDQPRNLAKSVTVE